MGTIKKVELREVTIFEQLSSETIAYVGNIYADDQKLGQAKNEGSGGMTRVYMTPGHLRELAAYARDHLAEEWRHYYRPDMSDLVVVADLFLSQLLQEWSDEQRWATHDRTATIANLTRGLPITARLHYRDKVQWVGATSEDDLKRLVGQMAQVICYRIVGRP